MERVILHCDANAFYASVECLYTPSIRHRPVAVCGSVEERHGIVLTKNQIAKQFGVQTGEAIWQARQKCPDLICVPPDYGLYIRFSKRMRRIYEEYSDRVESFGLDEAWIDLSSPGLTVRGGERIAHEIRVRVKRELGITVSVGVSFNKIFAKMGSEYKKPDATTVISRENFREILWPLAAGELFGVGRATSEKLYRLGIKTIGDIAASSRDYLTSIFGKTGGLMWDHANGLDESPVARYDSKEPVKSIGNGITFSRNLVSDSDISTAVKALSDNVAGRLRKQCLKAYGVKIDIKDPFFKVISRQTQLYAPTWLAEEIAAAAMDLLRASWKSGSPIRMITVTAINLTGDVDEEQLSLFGRDEASKKKSEKFEMTMDEVRKKYGNQAIGYASVVKNDMGIGFSADREDDGEE